MANEYAQVHRFGEKVAIYIGTGETVYLSQEDAKNLGNALLEFSNDIKSKKFTDSNVGTFRLNEAG